MMKFMIEKRIGLIGIRMQCLSKYRKEKEIVELKYTIKCMIEERIEENLIRCYMQENVVLMKIKEKEKVIRSRNRRIKYIKFMIEERIVQIRCE